MKRAWVLLLLVPVLLSTAAMGQAPAAAGIDPAKAMADLAGKTHNALGIVEFTVDDEMTGKPLPQPVAGMCICYDTGGASKKATVITTVLGSGVMPSLIKGTKVYLPGVEKPLNASYVATDPVSGITFVKVADTYDWQAVQFAEKADLTPGKPVLSVGLLDQALGFDPYLGMAYVSAQLRVPFPLVYVTGGNLTNIGSPVFNTNGVCIGIVLQQLPNVVTLTGQGGQGGNVVVSSQRETSCFVPVDDFASVLKNPPAPGAEPSWTGIIRFDRYPQDVLPLPSPAVKVAKVIPDSPAAKAGIKDGDVITQLNGKNLEKLSTVDLVRQELERQIARIPANTEFTLTVNGQPPVKIKAEAMPETPRKARKYFNELLGMVVRNKVPLDKYLDPSPATAEEKGIYVLGVVQSSPAAKAGLRGGPDYTLIETVMGKPVTTVGEFQSIVEGELQKNPKGAINMMVKHGTSGESITIQP